MSGINCAFDFIFRVNKSFLDSGTHPITIRKRYYDKLASGIKKNRQNVRILVDGNSVHVSINGYIYRGYAGYGLYYQIRIRDDEYAKIADVFQLGEDIRVGFTCRNNEWLIKLEKIRDGCG